MPGRIEIFTERFEILKMLGLNIASIGVFLVNAIYKNAPGWSITILVLSVAFLNIAKGYRLLTDEKRKKAEAKKKLENEKA